MAREIKDTVLARCLMFFIFFSFSTLSDHLNFFEGNTTLLRWRELNKNVRTVCTENCSLFVKS